jgi:hypothetical protein
MGEGDRLKLSIESKFGGEKGKRRTFFVGVVGVPDFFKIPISMLGALLGRRGVGLMYETASLVEASDNESVSTGIGAGRCLGISIG